MLISISLIYESYYFICLNPQITFFNHELHKSFKKKVLEIRFFDANKIIKTAVLIHRNEVKFEVQRIKKQFLEVPNF
jgi:hypothetical protein